MEQKKKKITATILHGDTIIAALAAATAPPSYPKCHCFCASFQKPEDYEKDNRSATIF